MNRTANYFALAIFVGVPLSLFGQFLTLEQATRLMLRHEPELNAAEYDTLSSMEEIKIRRSELMPQVSLRGSAGVSNRDRTTDGLVRSGETLFQRQLGMSIRQLLYDGGVARNETAAAENAMMAQQYLEKAMIEKRVTDLAEVYMEILRTEAQINLANENIENHKRMVSLIEKKVANGGHRTEMGLARSRLDRSQNSLSSLRLAHQRALIRFGRLVGQNVFELKQPVIPEIPHDINEVCLNNNWEFLAAAEALEEAEHRAKAARSQNAPRFYLDAGYTVGRDVIGVRGRDDEVSGLIVGEWNLFSGGRKKALQNREHFQVGKFEQLKRSADLARRQELDLLWQERSASRHSMETLTSYESDLQGVVDDFEKRFTLGREELLNILDIQNEYYAVASDLVDSKYDYNTSAFRIKGKQGKLAEWLLRLEGSEVLVPTISDAKNPQIDAVPVALEGDENLKDNREPLTQVELMKGIFDREGPTAEYAPPPLEQHYGEETNSRRGFFKRLFGRKRKNQSTTPSASSRPIN